jgi:hypothetical protein
LDEQKNKSLLTHLKTNGNYAEEHNMQLAALAFQVDIVEDIANPGPVLQKYHAFP